MTIFSENLSIRRLLIKCSNRMSGTSILSTLTQYWKNLKGTLQCCLSTSFCSLNVQFASDVVHSNLLWEAETRKPSSLCWNTSAGILATQGSPSSCWKSLMKFQVCAMIDLPSLYTGFLSFTYLLDIYAPDLGHEPKIDKMFSDLQKRVDRECKNVRQLIGLQGALDLVLAASRYCISISLFGS